MSDSVCLCVANIRTRLLQPLTPLVVSLSNHSSGVIIPLIPFDMLRMSGIMGQEVAPVVRMFSTAQSDMESDAHSS